MNAGSLEAGRSGSDKERRRNSPVPYGMSALAGQFEYSVENLTSYDARQGPPRRPGISGSPNAATKIFGCQRTIGRSSLSGTASIKMHRITSASKTTHRITTAPEVHFRSKEQVRVSPPIRRGTPVRRHYAAVKPGRWMSRDISRMVSTQNKLKSLSPQRDVGYVSVERNQTGER